MKVEIVTCRSERELVEAVNKLIERFESIKVKVLDVKYQVIVQEQLPKPQYSAMLVYEYEEERL